MVAPGPVTKLASTRSSSESVKASIQPAATAGQISGKVTVRKVAQRRAAEIHRRFLQAHVEGDEARLHHHGDEAQVSVVCAITMVQKPRSISSATNSSSSASPVMTSGMTSGA